MPKKILFLTLKIFSATGGIERMNRSCGKALQDLAIESGGNIKIFCVHDAKKDANDQYFPLNTFITFNSRKYEFAIKSIFWGVKSNVVILSHVNLLVVGYLIKLISPKTKLVLFAHGIEVWKKLPFWKRHMLNQFDLITPVSNYTKKVMKDLHKIPEEKFTILHSCIDPFLTNASDPNQDLLLRYGLKITNFVMLTLTRLSSKEKYKGYDKVIKSMYNLIKAYPQIRYLIVGKYDEKEKTAVDRLIKKLDLQNKVILTGFVNDNELAAHFNLADLYIMPSLGEGFGLVFIEAMYYGIPVIAGNADGSVDALSNGELGILINPLNKEEISLAVKKVINNQLEFVPDHSLLMKKFSYSVYKKRLQHVIENL